MKKQAYNFLEGEVLLFDKPIDWTSFDVVNKVRGMLKRKLGVKKLKVGHAGTLDPLATGLLVLCTGKKTKTIANLLSDDKVYTGKIQLGISTPSYDLESEIMDQKDVTRISEEQILEAARSLEGEIIQVPPVFSAKRIDGERAYKKARDGEKITMQGRPVFVYEFLITEIQMPFVSFRIKASKGTYIRSIANDLGGLLDNLGTLIELRRIQSGAFHINNALSITEFEEILTGSTASVSICK